MVQYRQAISRAFDEEQDALRLIDRTAEASQTAATKTVTVSTTVLDISSFFELDGSEIEATFQVISGGPVNFNPTSQPPTAGGTEGSQRASAGDIVKVTGLADITNLQMVRATGGSDAEVRGALVRRA